MFIEVLITCVKHLDFCQTINNTIQFIFRNTAFICGFAKSGMNVNAGIETDKF